MSTKPQYGPISGPITDDELRRVTRRGFFDRASDGVFGAALATLLCNDGFGADQHTALQSYDLTVKRPHFQPAARAVIHLCMQGGPSQVDLFDPKPALKKHNGSTPPRELTAGAVFENDRRGKLMQSPWSFAQYGQSGAWFSELLPHTAKHADRLCIVRSMFNVHPNHEPAIFKLASGQTFPGHPTFGSWITYGLGSENQDLPGYVVLADPAGRLPVNGVENWMSGYLPPLYQGTRMRPGKSPLLNLRPDFDESVALAEAKRDLIARLDRLHQDQRPHAAVLDARMRNYEMAARMQLEATEALATDNETAETLEMYGIGDKTTETYGRQCLLARRLVERGVRFIQLFTRGQAWDNHRDIRKSLTGICQKTDKPVAGLLQDLQQRGLLDSTLVIWGGEFGRLPTAQGDLKTAGRDHGPYGFTSWMAGGGVRSGLTYGSTDEVGYTAADQRVSIQDWHATMLHLLGLDYERLVFRRHGLGERLTHQFDTRVVQELIA